MKYLYILVVLLSSNPAFAGYSEGEAAYRKGLFVEAVKEFQPLAEQGDAKAQTVLGWLYTEGKGVKQDYKQALSWFTKAAEQGDANAQSELGNIYANGRGVKVDLTQAANWFHKAAAQGHVNSQFNLGIMYEKGLGVEIDNELAGAAFLLAGEQGFIPAQLKIGKMYCSGQVDNPKFSESGKWIRNAAAAGNPAAQLLLIENSLVEYPKKIEYLQSLSNSGNPIATLLLGFEYANPSDGNVLKQNNKESKRLLSIAVPALKKIADKDANAMFYLGQYFSLSAQDDVESTKWFIKAAESGHLEAMREVAQAAEYGRGMPESLVVRVRWILERAKRGFVLDQTMVADLLIKSPAAADKTEALKWFNQAANRGDDVSKMKLAWYYNSGKNGLQQDYEKALKLYRSADDSVDAEVLAGLLTYSGKTSRYLNDYAITTSNAGLMSELKETGEWIKSNKSHDADAQYFLGQLYTHGWGYKEDSLEAIKWFSAAAKQGHAKALWRIGYSNFYGYNGFAKDAVEAKKYFQMSADKGYGLAAYWLGAMYDVDHKESANWYRKAIELGYSKAKNDLQHQACHKDFNI